MTIDELLETYSFANMIRPTSIRSYRNAVAVFKKTLPPEAINNVSSITELMVNRFRVGVMERSRGTTWNTYRGQLKVLFGYALQIGAIEKCPITPVKRVRIDMRLPKTLKHQQFVAIIDWILSNSWPQESQIFWRTVTEVLYYTAIRRRQLVGLRWSDIDFSSNEILLRAESSKNHREWKIPISDALRVILLQYREAVAKRTVISPESQVFNQLLFCSNRKSPLSPAAITNYYGRIGKALGFPVSPHRFRHSTATQLANSEINLKVVQHLLGHTDIKTTSQYIQPDMNAMRRAVNSVAVINQ